MPDPNDPAYKFQMAHYLYRTFREGTMVAVDNINMLVLVPDDEQLAADPDVERLTLFGVTGQLIRGGRITGQSVKTVFALTAEDLATLAGMLAQAQSGDPNVTLTGLNADPKQN